MSYKIGDRFVIEIDRIYSSKKHAESRYGIKGFANFVLDRKTLDKLIERGCITNADESIQGARGQAEKAGYAMGHNDGYSDGMNDAWNAAARIEGGPQDGGLANEEIYKIFGEPWVTGNVFRRFTAEEAVNLIREYEEQKEESETYDKYLADWCEENFRGCQNCIIKQLFPMCGRGWHVFSGTEKEREAARKLTEAADLMRGSK